jgi:hypothetical protein
MKNRKKDFLIVIFKKDIISPDEIDEETTMASIEMLKKKYAAAGLWCQKILPHLRVLSVATDNADWLTGDREWQRR